MLCFPSQALVLCLTPPLLGLRSYGDCPRYPSHRCCGSLCAPAPVGRALTKSSEPSRQAQGAEHGHVRRRCTHGHASSCRHSGGAGLIEEFDRQNEPCTRRASVANSFRARSSRHAVPGNLNYVVIAVVGGYRVASGALSLGDIQAFIQYSRQFTMPITRWPAR